MTFLRPDQRQTLIWCAIGVALCVLLYSLSAVLTPFLMAGILGYILNPGVDWLERHRCPRTVAALLMIALLTVIAAVLVLTIVPVLREELAELQRRAPDLLDRLNSVLTPHLQTWFGSSVTISGSSLAKLASDQLAGVEVMPALISSLKLGGGAVLKVAALAFLVPVVLIYLLLDWHVMLRKLDAAVPRRWHALTATLAREIDEILAQFLRGQLSVMILLAAYYSIALEIAGFDVALPVGLCTGLLVFVPYLGFGIGLLLALLAAFLQFGSWYGVIAVAVVFGVGQVLEGFFLTPRLVGHRIGLHPVAVIFALLAFGQLFGFFGVLLALPASAALLVGLRHLKVLYQTSEFYRRS